jgi:divalent metal cation (Fe/Co/Zn/Cd) transporter
VSQVLCLEACQPCADCCDCELPTADSRRRLQRAAWALTVATILWNSLEAVIALASGVVARSIALVGFGLDSVVETTSALIVAWRLTRSERSEQLAVRLIALSFFGVAAYITFDAVAQLVGRQDPSEHSPVGIAVVALSLLVMPLLAWGKRGIAWRLGSITLQADAAETQVCFYLSVVVLVGLASNLLAGWWWMDPIAGLVVAGVAFYEGQRAWSHGNLCAAGMRQLCGPECCPACPLG